MATSSSGPATAPSSWRTSRPESGPVRAAHPWSSGRPAGRAAPRRRGARQNIRVGAEPQLDVRQLLPLAGRQACDVCVELRCRAPHVPAPSLDTPRVQADAPTCSGSAKASLNDGIFAASDRTRHNSLAGSYVATRERLESSLLPRQPVLRSRWARGARVRSYPDELAERIGAGWAGLATSGRADGSHQRLRPLALFRVPWRGRGLMRRTVWP